MIVVIGHGQSENTRIHGDNVTTLWIFSHLSMELDRFDKVAQQIVGVAQVTVGSALCRSVSQLFDQAQVHPKHMNIVQLQQSWCSAQFCFTF